MAPSSTDRLRAGEFGADRHDASQPTAGAPDTEPSPRAVDAGDPSPHAARVVVWDVPPTVERGRRFAARLGIACSAGCRPAGWRVEVRDHEGARRATAPVGDEPWPGTDALYHAEIALVAPDADGLYTWEATAVMADCAESNAAVTGGVAVKGSATARGGADGVGGVVPEPGGAASRGVSETGVAAEVSAAAVAGDVAVAGDMAVASDVAVMDGAATAHVGGRARFGVRVVSAPECLVTVAAVDAESGAPVAGARVVAHPYRAVTDARGVAELQVPAGRYRLFVSGKGCIPFRFDGEVTADTSIRAELEPDRELSDADIWS